MEVFDVKWLRMAPGVGVSAKGRIRNMGIRERDMKQVDEPILKALCAYVDEYGGRLTKNHKTEVNGATGRVRLKIG